MFLRFIDCTLGLRLFDDPNLFSTHISPDLNYIRPYKKILWDVSGQSHEPGPTALLVRRDEPFQRPVVGPLHPGGEQASRQLPVAPVVLYAFAAFALSAAGLVRAAAVRFIGFDVAFHAGNPNIMDNHLRNLIVVGKLDPTAITSSRWGATPRIWFGLAGN